jgi:apolipoprotein N-acyltransferase
MTNSQVKPIKENIFTIFIKKYSLSILSGIFIGTSYIPFPPWAQIFAFVPLWIAWSRAKSLKEIFWMGWLTQWLLTLIGFNWIAHTVSEFGGMPWFVSIPVLFLFCSVANLDIPLSGILWAFLNKKYPTSRTVQFIRLGLIIAFFEAWVPTLFPWNYGYPWLWVHWPIAQTAEWIGFQGLSSVMILLNVGICLTVINWKTTKAVARFYPAGISLIAFVLLNALGGFLSRSLPTEDKSISVTITQANIGNQMKIAAEQGRGYRAYILDKYVSLTDQAIQTKGTDLILWPETAIPYEFDFDSYFSRPVESLFEKSKLWNSFLITGGYGYSDNINHVTNSLFIIDPNLGIQREYYFKTILLAFGEYIPFGDTFPKLYDYIPAGHFRKGPGPKIVSIEKNGEKINLGPQICYESLFPSFTQKLADMGAQVIVNVTNDSWYGTWQEPYQHLYMTAARAVEFRRPLIRSTNTGISAVVTARGDVLNPSPMQTEWVGQYDLPYFSQPKTTIYQRLPWLMDILLLLGLGFGLFWSKWKKE